jgi:hypothetical protein
MSPHRQPPVRLAMVFNHDMFSRLPGFLYRFCETHDAKSRFFQHRPQRKVRPMTIDIVAIQPLIALVAGILILLVPRILNYVVAIYLIIIGVMGLWPHVILHTPH